MWLDLEGHDERVDQFRRILSRGRLASTYLFVGPSGIGKRTFALRLAQSLVCPESPPERLAPCNACPTCVQIRAQTHPDLLQVARPVDRAEIPVRLIIGPPERRMQEGLCHDLWQKPLPGSRRIAIIDDADALNEECSNALLKTLEEPPPGAVVFLIGTHAERQLPTIRSRSQIIRFQPLATDVVARLLLQQGRAADLAEAQCLAQRSGGSLDESAIEAVGQFEQFRDRWLGLLARCPLDSLAAAKMAIAFADEAGKEASARRQRLRQVIDATVDFCTALLRHQVGSDPGVALSAAVEHAAKSWPADDELALRCAERSHQAGEHLDRFVNPATLVECWLDDLAREQTLVLR